MERLEYCRVPGMPGVEALLAERGAVTRWTYRGKLHASHAEGLMLMEPGEVHVNPCHANPLPSGRPISVHCSFRRPSSSAPRPTSASTPRVAPRPWHSPPAHALHGETGARGEAAEPRRFGARTRCAAPALRADGEPRGISGFDRL